MFVRTKKETDLQVMSIVTNGDGIYGMQALTEGKNIVYIIPNGDEPIQFPEHLKKAVFLRFWENKAGEFFADYRTTGGRTITVNKNLKVVGVK